MKTIMSSHIKYSNGSYRTMPGRVSLLSRAFPSMVFYAKVAAIAYRGSCIARRGGYTDAEWQKSSISTIRALEGVGVRLEITGMENVESLDGPCVFVSNHMSTLETFALPSLILPFKDVSFVIKKSLVEYPVFKHIMRAVRPVIVGRANPREDLKAVLEEGAEGIREGRSIVIFPQTTRSCTFEPERFNTLGIKLALRAGAPVIPIALKSDAWGNGRIIREMGRIDPRKSVHIAFGDPLRITGRGGEEHKAVIEFIRSKLRAWESL